MNEIPEDVMNKLKEFGLDKFVNVGSNNYPNIISANWSKKYQGQIWVEFLQLNGETKVVYFWSNYLPFTFGAILAYSKRIK